MRAQKQGFTSRSSADENSFGLPLVSNLATSKRRGGNQVQSSSVRRNQRHARTGRCQDQARNKTTGRKPVSHSRGDLMRGAGRRSVTNASGIGWASSSAVSRVAVAHIAGQSAPLSCRVHFSRHMSRTAQPPHVPNGVYFHGRNPRRHSATRGLKAQRSSTFRRCRFAKLH